MIVATALLAMAGATGWVSPRLLRRPAAGCVCPRIAGAAWIAAHAVFVGALLAVPVALATKPGLRWESAPLLASTCVRALRERGVLPWLGYVEAGVWLLAALLLARIGAVALAAHRRHRRAASEHAALVTLVGETRPDPDGGTVVWLPGQGCVAYSVGGPRGVVVAGTGLDRLSPAGRRAVLTHERAHLRGRHHLLVSLGSALGAALPFVPLCRDAAGWARVLVELDADRRAAAACGVDAVREALLAGAATGPRSRPAALADRLALLGCAGRATRRWEQLPRAASASMLPALVTAVAVPALVTLGCRGLALAG